MVIELLIMYIRSTRRLMESLDIIGYLLNNCHGSTQRTSDSVGFLKIKLEGLFYIFYFSTLSDLYSACRFMSSSNRDYSYVRFAM